MSDASSLKREDFLRVLNLVKPALAAQSFVPILTHFLLKPDRVLAYNDVQGIEAGFAVGLDCAVPGELLTKILNNLKAEEVLCSMLEGQVLVSAGRSRLKMSFLPAANFPFKFPDTPPVTRLQLNPDFIRGLTKCLTSVGSDPTRPEQLGVTLTPGPCLYATDNHTISKYKVLEADADFTQLKDQVVILPFFFCEQLISLAAAYSDQQACLDLYTGAAVATVGKARCFTKLAVDLEPLDFDKIIKKHVSESEVAELECEVPDDFDAAFDRALLVLSGETDKTTRVTLDGKRLFLLSSSSTNEVRDQITLGKEYKAEADFLVDPVLVARGLKVSSKAAFMPKVFVLRDLSGQFLHLIAHCTAPTK